MDLTPWTVIARILRPQGRKGEVLADLLTDFPERFSDRRTLTFITPSGEHRQATLEHHWLPVGKNAGKIVLHFAGIDNISKAEELAGFSVAIPDQDRVPLEEGSFYVSDLVGCTLADEEHTLGVIRDVHFPTDTHGNRVPEAVPILVVESPAGDELLIPLAKAWLHKPDIANKHIEMRLPPGLLEING